MADWIDAGLKPSGVTDKDVDDARFQLTEIDPFTFFVNFNRGTSDDNRRSILSALKEAWGLRSDLPTDFDALPVMNPQNSWFMPYKKKREHNHVATLWRFYKHCQKIDSVEQMDTELFDACRQLLQVGVASLTMGMFWSRPDFWIAADSKNRSYARSLGVMSVPEDGKTYLAWLREVRDRSDKSTCEFSLQAHLNTLKGKASPEPNASVSPNADQADLSDDRVRSYWLLAPGEGARLWDNWYAEGIGAIGWNAMGDLRDYDSKEAMAEYLPKVLEDSGPVHVAQMLWAFSREMKPGDIVFAKHGLWKTCGWGIVTGDYEHDDSQEPYHNLRKIDWKSGVEKTMPTGVQLPLKTITRMTPKTKYLSQLAQQYGDVPGLESESIATEPPKPSPAKPTHAPYGMSDAMDDLFMSAELVETCVELLRRKKNLVLQGAPGTGKTFVAKRLAYLLMGEKDESRVQMVQFHQSLTYEDFVQGFKPSGEGHFKLEKGTFHNFVDAALAKPDMDFVFVIDEINRGNLSKVFGELMMLIEPDKRSSDFAIPLSYSSDRDATFYVPPNVHLIGTMNTADRSLSMVDYALRRRFTFVELDPGFGSDTFGQVLVRAGASPELISDVRERMKRLNEMIASDEANLGRGYRIGHSFFCRTDGEPTDEAWLRNVLSYEIKPLLEEYYCDDPKLLRLALEVLE
ncbi:AAA family ATPase [Botrimarina mediterranea]|nr:AAA family ATPase [Botrimarina mediterranea]